MRLATVLRNEWLVIVLGIGGIVGLVLVLQKCDDPWGRGQPEKSDMQLVDGNPRKTAVSVYHDSKRGVTCYVGYQYAGLSCFLDITLEDQKHMLAYRDGGAP